MSILIPNVKMPDECYKCFASRCDDPEIDDDYCSILKEDTPLAGKRSDCPLVEIPKHGRLIDADVLCKRLLESWDTADKEKKTLINAIMGDIVTPIVVGTPTIIEGDTE